MGREPEQIKGQLPITSDMEWGDGPPLEKDEIAEMLGMDSYAELKGETPDDLQEEYDESKHPRDDHGRWTDSGGGNTATATRTKESALLDRLKAPDGGFTYSPTMESEPTGGYAVSPYPERSKVFTADSLTEDDLLTYVVTNWDVLSQPDHYLGAWHDPATGKVFLDVSVVKANEAEAHALALAKDQIAIFDLTNMKSIDVNRAAKSGQGS